MSSREEQRESFMFQKLVKKTGNLEMQAELQKYPVIEGGSPMKKLTAYCWDSGYDAGVIAGLKMAAEHCCQFLSAYSAGHSLRDLAKSFERERERGGE